MAQARANLESVNLRDTRWRVEPLGWFSDDEEQPDSKTKNFKGVNEGQGFYCISQEELDNLVIAKPPINTEYSIKWLCKTQESVATSKFWTLT